MKAFVERHGRLLALALLALVTLLGLSFFFQGNWREALRFWRGKGEILLLAAAIHLFDISFDSILWRAVMKDLGIRIPLRKTWVLYLSGYAGILLPAQLGRFIRPDSLSRMKLAPFGEAVRGEAALLYCTLSAAMAVLAGVISGLYALWLAPIAVLIVISASLLTAHLASTFLRRTPIRFPAGYWLRPRLFLLTLCCMIGWCFCGLELYLVIHDLGAPIALWQTIILAPANMIAGMASGMPGGLGAIEGLLGVSLRFLEVPPEQWVLAVGAFRLVSFWLWLPIGWAALMLVNRCFLQERIPNDNSRPQ